MDYVRLQQIIPEDVWAIVTALLLKSPSDLENLANSSSYFQNLLAPKRTIFLFEKALELVGSTIWNKNDFDGQPVKDLIKYREVCSHWKSAVDKLIFEKFQFLENISSRYAGWELLKNSFSDGYYSGSVYRFMNHFQNSHSDGTSPFILRSLSIDITDRSCEENQRRYLEGLDMLISTYGVHIQHLTVDIQNNIQFLNNLSRFRCWIQYMPKLTKLSVYYSNNWGGQRVVEHDENDETFKIDHLKCLDTRNLPSSVFNLLIRQNSHVSTLLMKNCKDDYDFFTFPLPNLKKLEMEYCSAQLLITLDFPEVEWPLEALSLIFGNEDNVGCAALFKVIQTKFAKTLVSLELSLNAADMNVEGPVWQGFKTSRLDLPELKKLKLDVGANLTCLEFLLPMRNNLEEIAINGGRIFPLTYQRHVTRGITVQFIGFEDKMLESNIWEMLTKLKKFEVMPRWDRVHYYQKWSYSREEWLRRQF